MLKPVILITLYRRYTGLTRALRNIQLYQNEFTIKPDVIIIWSQPEPCMNWLVKENDIVNHVISREKLQYEGERGGTTYPESHNIRIGLEYIRDNYINPYVIVQASDIEVQPECYRQMDTMMQDGKDAVVFHWANNMVSVGAYHTNLFAVSMSEKHWPPVANYDEHDCLEWMWGRWLNNYWMKGRYPEKYNYSLLNKGLFTENHNESSYYAKSPLFFSCLSKDVLSCGLSLQIIGTKQTWLKLLTLYLKNILATAYLQCVCFLQEEN